MLFILLLFTIQIFDLLHLGYHYIDDNIIIHLVSEAHNNKKHSDCFVDSTIDNQHIDNCQKPNQIENKTIKIDKNELLSLNNINSKNQFNKSNENICFGHNQTHLFFSELDLKFNIKLDYACHLGHLVLKLNFVKEIEKYFDFNNISKILKISTNFLDFPANTFTSYSNKAPPQL